jgi:hypothetical protein
MCVFSALFCYALAGAMLHENVALLPAVLRYHLRLVVSTYPLACCVPLVVATHVQSLAVHNLHK